MHYSDWGPDKEFIFEPDNPIDWSEEDWELFFKQQDRRVYSKPHQVKPDYQEYFNGQDAVILTHQNGLNTGVTSHWLNSSEESFPECLFPAELDILNENRTESGDGIAHELSELPAYQLAADLNHLFSHFIISSMEKGNNIPELRQINHQFFQIQFHIASGYYFGFEREAIPANIAKVKRALKSTQMCLDALFSMKRKELESEQILNPLIHRIIELRDTLVHYMIELRNLHSW